MDRRNSYEKPSIQIAELSPDDWQLLRDLKLKSLEEEMVAFEDPGEGKKKYLQRSEAEWRDILSGKMSGGRPGESLHVFAKSGEQFVGMVSAIIPESQPEKIATIQHMYVDTNYRGYGAGKELLRGLIDKLKARENIRKIVLQVITIQIPAIELYKSLGFTEVGRKENVQRRGDQTYSEIEMELGLYRKTDSR